MFSISWRFAGAMFCCILFSEASHDIHQPRGDAVPNGDGQNHLTVVVDEGPQIALPVLRDDTTDASLLAT